MKKKSRQSSNVGTTDLFTQNYFVIFASHFRFVQSSHRNLTAEIDVIVVMMNGFSVSPKDRGSSLRAFAAQVRVRYMYLFSQFHSIQSHPWHASNELFQTYLRHASCTNFTYVSISPYAARLQSHSGQASIPPHAERK